MTEEAPAKEQPRTKDIPRNVEPYYIALLLKGERWNDTRGADVADLVPRQLAFIREQVQAGRYLLAGPITFLSTSQIVVIRASLRCER